MTSDRVTGPRGLCFLVVDDHADSVRALALLLRHAGHSVTTALTFAGAVEAAARMPAIDVLIGDMGLPDGDGCELLRLLLRRPGGGPRRAVMLTGRDDDRLREQSERAGYDLFLVKPVAVEQLMAAIAPPPPAAPATSGGVPLPAARSGCAAV